MKILRYGLFGVGKHNMQPPVPFPYFYRCKIQLLQVVIVAEGKLPSDAYHAAVDNITISSKQCERSPPHSAPGTKIYI